MAQTFSGVEFLAANRYRGHWAEHTKRLERICRTRLTRDNAGAAWHSVWANINESVDKIWLVMFFYCTTKILKVHKQDTIAM